MKEDTVVKQVVNFRGRAELVGTSVGKRIAHIFEVVNHPRLGSCPWVSTSLVQEVDDETNPTIIETMNTVYKKV